MKRVIIRVKREARIVLTSLIVLLILLAAFPSCEAKVPEVVAPSHLKVVTLPYIGFATYYLSQEEGYFAEQGLEVEFVKFTSASQAIPLIAQGSLDVVAGSLSASLINAIAQNINIKVVAGREYVSPDWESSPLLVRKDIYDSGEVDSIAELKGKKIAVSCLGCLTDFILSKQLETGDLSLADVHLVKVGQAETLVAFENRAIEAALLGDQHGQRIKDLGYAVTIQSTDKVFPGFQKAFVMYGPNLMEKNPELGEKFMVAFLKGVRQYNQGKTKRNLEILQKYLADEETLLKLTWDPIYPDGRIKVDDIFTFQDWAYKNDFVDKKIAVEQLVDTRFIDYANKVLGPAK